MASEPVDPSLVRNTHAARGDGAIPREAIERSLQADGFAILRGVVDPTAVREAVSRLRAAFRAEDDHPTVGESPADVRRNFQKLAVGTVQRAHPLQSYARLLRVIFTPFFADDRYGVHVVLRPLAVLRNRLLGLGDDYAIGPIEGGVWTAARIQHYPCGGGFLASHVDANSVAVSETRTGRYVQLLLAMTQRGVDFERGGAYLERPTGRLDLEAGLRPGDVLVYDGRGTHGVADIDPHRVLDLRRLEGRLVGLVNLYEAR